MLTPAVRGRGRLGRRTQVRAPNEVPEEGDDRGAQPGRPPVSRTAATASPRQPGTPFAPPALLAAGPRKPKTSSAAVPRVACRLREPLVVAGLGSREQVAVSTATHWREVLRLDAHPPNWRLLTPRAPSRRPPFASDIRARMTPATSPLPSVCAGRIDISAPVEEATTDQRLIGRGSRGSSGRGLRGCLVAESVQSQPVGGHP